MSGNPSKSAFFEKGWVTFGEYLTGKVASPTKQCWCQKTRVIAVSCGIKIFAVHHLVLSQYTRGQTDRQTDRISTAIRALRYMQSHGKNGSCSVVDSAGQGGARPPDVFWCNLQPKICKSVTVSPKCTIRPSNIFTQT